ncbi:MAG: transposase [Acetobacteraceae bacterium]|nr:transposase [Acetobacteraceae bacterium]
MRAFLRDGVWEGMRHHFLAMLREGAGQEASPTAAVIDTQSAETTESGGPRGWDAAKRLKGSKRHVEVNTDGLLLGVLVHAADIRDGGGLGDLLRRVKPPYPWLRAVFADSIHKRLTAHPRPKRNGDGERWAAARRRVPGRVAADARDPRVGGCRPAGPRIARRRHAGAGPCCPRPKRRPSGRTRTRATARAAARSDPAARPCSAGRGDPGMAAISDLVSAVVNKPVAAAARLARRALERIAPETGGAAEAAPRKSKGWRKHVRRAKARQRSAQG